MGGGGERTSRLSNPWVQNNAHHPLEKKIYRTILPSLQLKFIFVILHLPFNHTFSTMIDSKFQVLGKIPKNVCLHILIKFDKIIMKNETDSYFDGRKHWRNLPYLPTEGCSSFSYILIFDVLPRLTLNNL